MRSWHYYGSVTHEGTEEGTVATSHIVAADSFFFCERRRVLGKIPRRRSRNWLPSSPALISNGGYVYCDR